MSRGFIKEDDQEAVPMVPPRAFLPPGVPNYVTPSGLEALQVERETLLRERDALDASNENERRIAVNHLHARLQLLDQRIASARLMEPGEPPPEEIRFGATVTIRTKGSEELQTICIVGVDEADVSQGKISFISPLAKILIHKTPGEFVVLKLPREERTLEVVRVEYV
jgi:transcription elongation factor GreB